MADFVDAAGEPHTGALLHGRVYCSCDFKTGRYALPEDAVAEFTEHLERVLSILGSRNVGVSGGAP